jgi:hypothetical protein
VLLGFPRVGPGLAGIRDARCEKQQVEDGRQEEAIHHLGEEENAQKRDARQQDDDASRWLGAVP